MKYTGFTLIELLIVVAIIAILAAIAIPNFLQAQTRAKVSRARADIRSIATGQESYYVDHNQYPEPMQLPHIHHGHHDHHSALNHGHHHHGELWEGFVSYRLTTPVAYLSSIPFDPFTRRTDVNIPFHYLTRHYQAELGHPEMMTETTQAVLGSPFTEIQYTIFSHGPDLDHPHDIHDAVQYDPTNGTISTGSIWYFGPGLGFGI